MKLILLISTLLDDLIALVLCFFDKRYELWNEFYVRLDCGFIIILFGHSNSWTYQNPPINSNQKKFSSGILLNFIWRSNKILNSLPTWLDIRLVAILLLTAFRFHKYKLDPFSMLLFKFHILCIRVQSEKLLYSWADKYFWLVIDKTPK